MIGSNTQTNGGKELNWREKSEALSDISTTLNSALADMFTLYFKTKNFHWHVTGPHFRDHHLLFDEQASQIFVATGAVAERVRKIGGATIRSIAHVARLARLSDSNQDCVTPIEMLTELRCDNERLTEYLREAHLTCTDYEDVASASLLETLIDESERRRWFLFETTRQADGSH
jgi:starvation-inducible DNA-binding protein